MWSTYDLIHSLTTIQEVCVTLGLLVVTDLLANHLRFKHLYVFPSTNYGGFSVPLDCYYGGGGYGDGWWLGEVRVVCRG